MIEVDGWYRPRGYLHFDAPVGRQKASSLVSNPQRVATHSFMPFVSYTIESSKVFEDPTTSKLIKKSKQRAISYSSHMDSHIYSFYADVLSEQYEKELLKFDLTNEILAFRATGKSNVDFAANAFSEIKKRGACGVVALDVTGFFDNLDHVILKKRWSSLLGKSSLPKDHYQIYRSLTRYAKVDRELVYKEFDISLHNPKHDRFRICTPEEFRLRVRGKGLINIHSKNFGIPQGTPISALLSNIYLLEVDIKIKSFLSSINGKYYRYCDDMLFIVPIENTKSVADKIIALLDEVKLQINNSKTEIREFQIKDGRLTSDRPLQYLGFTYDGQRILIRSAALSRYAERMKKGVGLAKATMISRNKRRVERGQTPKDLYKKKLLQRYSHIGKRNFIRYGYRAADILDSAAIRAQLKPLWNRLIEQIGP